MEKLIQQFYSSFEQFDVESMVECYHPEIVFEDPAFGKLSGEQAKNMWRMLITNQKGKDFSISYSDVKGTNKNGSAHWEAKYNFSKTGRKVQNKIDAEFEFKDGLIIKHTDSFDLHSWAKQALGFKGFLLGGTSFFQKKLQTQTSKLLSDFEKKK